MKTRRKAREAALQYLYQCDAGVKGSATADSDGEEIENFFDHFKVPPGSRDFARSLIEGTIEEREKLDEQMESLASNWRIDRMALVDRNLLRMCLYEMIHIEDIAYSITVNEAVELAKLFGDKNSAAFVNGVLDSFAKNNPKTVKTLA